MTKPVQVSGQSKVQTLARSSMAMWSSLLPWRWGGSDRNLLGFARQIRRWRIERLILIWKAFMFINISSNSPIICYLSETLVASINLITPRLCGT
jgi:hypothetical protein